MKRTIALAIFVSVCFLPQVLLGQIFIWVDEQGVKHYTDQPPPEGARIIKEVPEISEASEPSDAQAASEQESQGNQPGSVSEGEPPPETGGSPGSASQGEAASEPGDRDNQPAVVSEGEPPPEAGGSPGSAPEAAQATSVNSCYLAAPVENHAYVIVYNEDGDGNRTNKIWEGKIPAGKKRWIVSAGGRIRFDVSFSPDNPAEGDNGVWCNDDETVGVEP